MMTNEVETIGTSVFVVDDDEHLRRLLAKLYAAEGLHVTECQSGTEFLEVYGGELGCLVLDNGMPGMCGLDVQEQLIARGATIPVIMMTGDADIATVVRAFRLGAWDFVLKPIKLDDLIRTTRAALRQADKLRVLRARRARAFQLFARLSTRENQVMELVLTGKTNVQIAEALSLSRKTIESHRARVMRKLQVCSLAELARLCQFRSAPPAIAVGCATSTGKYY